jgi:murein DD-endopeptidase MepM/ murein hydrolase activator NlpD
VILATLLALRLLTVSPEPPCMSTVEPPYAWPVAGRVTSGFGYRRTDCLFHNGIDIAATVGTPIRAPTDARVYAVMNTRTGFGRLLILVTPSGTTLWFGHLSRFSVKPHQEVKRGQVIGYTGASGNARGPHLHLEVRCAGSPHSPLLYLEEQR